MQPNPTRRGLLAAYEADPLARFLSYPQVAESNGRSATRGTAERAQLVDRLRTTVQHTPCDLGRCKCPELSAPRGTLTAAPIPVPLGTTKPPAPTGGRVEDGTARRTVPGCRAASVPLSESSCQGTSNVKEATPVATRNARQTGSKAASAASTVLASPKSTKTEKSAAASALSQTPRKK